MQQNQNIKYTGLATTPSDYDSPDGQLAVAMNTVNEEGGMKALRQPQVASASLGNRRVLFLHVTSAYRHFIIQDSDTDALYWISESYLKEAADPSQYLHEITNLPEAFGAVVTANAIGNTLVVMNDDGMHYLFWKDNNYKYLGQQPPELEMQFTTTNTFSLDGTWYSGQCNSTAEIWGLIYRLNKMVTDANRFYAPFKVRYCYRLFDGSMYMHSAPVFMPIATPYTYQVEKLRKYIQNIDGSLFVTPMPDYTSMEELWSGGNWHTLVGESKFRYQPNNVALQYRVLNDISASLKDWGDVVKSVDVFITPPILREIPDSALIDDNHERIEKPINHYTGTLAQKYRRLKVPDVVSPNISTDYFDMVEIPLYTEQEYLDMIKSASTFYKIASFDIGGSELKYDGTIDTVPIKTGILNALAQQEVMKDDYRTHNTLVPHYNDENVTYASMFAYNNRLNVSGVDDKLFKGFNIATMVPYDSSTSNRVKIVRTFVTMQTSDGKKSVERNYGNNGPWIRKIYLKNLPLFYPDNRAYIMYIGVLINEPPEEVDARYDLTMHEAPMLNGAYTEGGIINDPNEDPTFPSGGSMDIGASDTEITNSKVYTSEVENPLYFPALGINSVGANAIIATVSTTKALSQGQFGQFPLYAFTTEGIWALEVAADGTYTAMHPVTRDVCTNVASITQIDNAVLFVSDRGIMVLKGSDTACISDGILGDEAFDISTLPSLADLAVSRGIMASGDTIEPMTRVFLAGCRMLYDYEHQHIVVFNPEYSHAYVYSLKSKLWGMMQSTLASTINSYPDAMAIDKDGHLVSFGDLVETPPQGLLVTRPLKLGLQDVYKTIHTLKQTGMFRKGHVQTLLYGTRDGYKWYLVGSSVDEWIRGLRGTPWRWFRIALLTSLWRDESISGATVAFETKETNKMH